MLLYQMLCQEGLYFKLFVIPKKTCFSNEGMICNKLRVGFFANIWTREEGIVSINVPLWYVGKACYCQHMICWEGLLLPTYDMPERLAIANIWYVRKACCWVWGTRCWTSLRRWARTCWPSTSWRQTMPFLPKTRPSSRTSLRDTRYGNTVTEH